jgi:hypothetical protein
MWRFFCEKLKRFLGNIYLHHKMEQAKIIQKWYRGSSVRKRRLPLILYYIQQYLRGAIFEFSNKNEDGRINSCIDEDEIIKVLFTKFANKIKKPKIRMWYDILVLDSYYGWLPVNIKTTTTTTSDNTGNLAMCVYAYTDQELDIHRDKSYDNGIMSVILFEKLRNKKVNRRDKKDYYFIVLNKTNKMDIIVNSVKGLTTLTPNANNLPFQICWDKNRNFIYEKIENKIRQFVECIKKPKPSWKETFMSNMRTLT